MPKVVLLWVMQKLLLTLMKADSTPIPAHEACHTMQEGEILNAKKVQYPLLHAIVYGDKVRTAKLSKRLSCAIKHLPLRIKFSYEYDTQKAVEKGLRKDPTLVLDGEIFLEGLLQAETITNAFENHLKKDAKC